MNKIIIIPLILISAIFLTYCTENKIDSTILPAKNNKICLIIDSLIVVDSLTCFKIVLQNKDERIKEAYYNCGHLEKRSYNFDKYSLNNCDTKLVLENDTVIMWATYEKVGTVKFDDLTLIIEDKDSNLSYIDTTFSFIVKENKLPR